uniref:Uncharacterized protein n=1 Tax=Tanacetum cinerariifolium TaxID=118510 RepID=A0A6L2M5I0_TANCI|nr:hypothetical protein [Tanacetum cinerariifolium]
MEIYYIQTHPYGLFLKPKPTLLVGLKPHAPLWWLGEGGGAWCEGDEEMMVDMEVVTRLWLPRVMAAGEDRRGDEMMTREVVTNNGDEGGDVVGVDCGWRPTVGMAGDGSRDGSK